MPSLRSDQLWIWSANGSLRLSIRLGKFVDKLILNSHSTFMKGGNIMNGVLTLHEVLHETKRRNEVGVVLKLDFEKAYD